MLLEPRSLSNQSKGRGKSRGSADSDSGGSGPAGPALGPMGGPGIDEVQGPMVQPLSTPTPSTLSSLPIAGADAGAKADAEAAGEELEEKHGARTSMDPAGYGETRDMGVQRETSGYSKFLRPQTLLRDLNLYLLCLVSLSSRATSGRLCRKMTCLNSRKWGKLFNQKPPIPRASQ